MALVSVHSAEGLCADLTDLHAAGRVMVYQRHAPGHRPWNQQWEIVPTGNGHGVNVRTIASGVHPSIIVGINDHDVRQGGNDATYEGTVWGGGPRNVFLAIPERGTDGGFRIAYPSEDEDLRPYLYWTVESSTASTVVKLMKEDAENPSTQLWKFINP